jgi:hypothetical protein
MFSGDVGQIDARHGEKASPRYVGGQDRGTRLPYRHGWDAAPFVPIGKAEKEPTVRIRSGGDLVLEEDARNLRNNWEATSFELDRLQANPDCVDEDQGQVTEAYPFNPNGSPHGAFARPMEGTWS